ncbi:efflux RND transporter periplasmic adaptor subunit [Undibacterium sp. TJN19]|uniref:efflux RND transporter periplasmic adaptor subunit n=1 Tax=Undibacterium sp. TJN19 TaxID=3413055 RepID=UPI003BF019DA
MRKYHTRRHTCSALIAPVLITLLLSGCNKESDPASKKDAAAEEAKLPLVRDAASIRIPELSPLRKSLVIAPVAEQSIERAIVIPGTIEIDAASSIKVVPPVTGRIIQLNKRLGDNVKVGDALFSIDSADIALAYSDANKAQSALLLAKRNLQRQKDLVDAEIAARKDFEQAEADYAQANSEATRTKARLTQLGASAGASAGHQYQLRSPIAGRVIELTGAQGGFWNDTNAPLMTVADLSSVWMVANIQEKDLSQVFLGQTAKITLNAYDNESFEGKVRYIGDVLDADTRTIKVRIAIDNHSGRFKPGMFAKVNLSGQKHQSPAIPTSALVQNGFNTRVFVEKSPWVFEPRIVKTAAQVGDQIEILSGLKAGERIVVKEGVLLND